MATKLTQALPVLIVCALAGLLAGACSSAQEAGQGQRFLYVVNCDARVDKLDTFERKKVESFNLSARSGSPPAVPTAPDGKMDGCLAQRVLVDAAAHHVSLMSPKEARLDSDGMQEFQAVTFTLPDWKLVSVQSAGRHPEAPRLQHGATGDLKVLSEAEWLPVTQLDLRGYKGHDGNLGGLILASSGNTSLLSLLSATSVRLTLGLASQTARTVVGLTNLPQTTLRHIQLAPGGGFVLVEATQTTGASASRTGVLSLYDTSGKQVAEWADQRVREMAFVALTPNGTAVYHKGLDYVFIPMGRSFGNAPVVKPMPDLAEPGLVFSAQ